MIAFFTPQSTSTMCMRRRRVFHRTDTHRRPRRPDRASWPRAHTRSAPPRPWRSLRRRRRARQRSTHAPAVRSLAARVIRESRRSSEPLNVRAIAEDSGPMAIVRGVPRQPFITAPPARVRVLRSRSADAVVADQRIGEVRIVPRVRRIGQGFFEPVMRCRTPHSPGRCVVPRTRAVEKRRAVGQQQASPRSRRDFRRAAEPRPCSKTTAPSDDRRDGGGAASVMPSNGVFLPSNGTAAHRPPGAGRRRRDTSRSCRRPASRRAHPKCRSRVGRKQGDKTR